MASAYRGGEAARGNRRSYEQNEREDEEYAATSTRRRRVGGSSNEQSQREQEHRAAPDPYNVASSQQVSQYHFQADTSMDRQLAYDSMSTILEVDSEGSELSGDLEARARDLGGNLSSPLEVRTSETPEARGGEQRRRAPEVARPVSPVEDKFGGTLSALAAQVERLRRSSESMQQQQQQPKASTSREEATRNLSPSSSEATTNRSSPSGSSGESSSSSAANDTSTSGHHVHRASASANTSAAQTPIAERLAINEDQDDDDDDGQSDGSRSSASRSSTSREDDATFTRPKSRAASADSLMMITLSPIGSPRGKFSLIKSQPQADGNKHSAQPDERRVVEVSHKSTITAIDLSLMNKMVEKYFVDTRDQGTQSIAFDCEPPAGNKGAAGQKVAPATMKSVAVGTEKFTRERFSLLPETKTRSTQTKANMDNDLGTSETRRFKLANLEFGPLIRGKSVQASTEQLPVGGSSISGGELAKVASPVQTIDSATDPIGGDSSIKTPHVGSSEQRVSASRRKSPSMRQVENTSNTKTSEADLKIKRLESELDKLKERQKLQDQRESQRSSRQAEVSTSPAAFNQDSLEATRVEVTANDQSASPSMGSTSEDEIERQDSLNENLKRASIEKKSSGTNQKQVALRKQVEIINLNGIRETSGQETSDQLSDNDNNNKTSNNRSNKQQVIETKTANKNDLIPCMKTELRVIIEIQDSKSRHRSEVHSDAQLIDGKLSKKTQVSTSKLVAVSPRQVFNKLQLAGRQHSLMYQPTGHMTQESGAAHSPAVVAANLSKQVAESRSSLHSASSMSNLSDRKQHRSSAETMNTDVNQQQQQQDGWREVSKSTVFNEFETDTNKKPKSATKSAANQRLKVIGSDKSRSSEEVVATDEQGNIMLSSQAIINHFANDKSSIDLRSRATKQTEEMKRDTRTGKLIKSGRVSERILVESEAGFNENEGSPEVPIALPTILISEETSKRQIGDFGFRSNEPRQSIEQQQQQQTSQKSSGGLIKRLQEQEEIAREKLGRQSPLVKPRELAAAAGSPGPYQSNNRLASYAQPRLATPLSARSTPNLSELRSPPVTRFTQQQQPPQQTQATSQGQARGQIEIEEETEDRRQVSRNGRLVYDDRLRERRYETQRVASSDLGAAATTTTATNPTMQRLQQGQAPTQGRSSPNLNGILRNSNQRQANVSLLKPISSPSPINAMPADQTSNLSASDPETMDSGFAQSGAGSSNLLNANSAANSRSNLRSQQLHQSSAPSSPRTMPTGSGGRKSMSSRTSPANNQLSVLEDEEGTSLTFVDDDVDELIEQLGGSRMLSPPPVGSKPATRVSSATPTRESPYQATARLTRDLPSGRLISPPPAFCSSEPALNRLGVEGVAQSDTYRLREPARDTRGGVASTHATDKPMARAPLATGDKDTEITTVLTRSRVLPAESTPTTTTTTTTTSQRRTRTQFEQNLVAPAPKIVPPKSDNLKDQPARPPNPWTSMANQLSERLCRFRAQVTFESDTDSASAAGDRQSVSSGAGASSPASRGGGQQHQHQQQKSAAASQATHRKERKELLSETKYTLSDVPCLVGGNEPNSSSRPKSFARPGEAQVSGASKHFATSQQQQQQQPLAPNWDYSLRVNRMRGNKVDSKVNTYIKHSRQPLINLEAAS